MKKFNMALTSVLLTSTAFAAASVTTGAKAAAANDVNSDLPRWVVVDDSWWYPLRMDSVDAVNNARYYYRRNNERAAADEVRKAASWLSYAADNALPETKEALLAARTNLLTLAEDLDTGKLAGAARLDKALAEASDALAEWHYYRARDEFGRHDSVSAAQDLEAAAGNLESAAASAHFQYGPDTITVFDDVYRNGRMVSDGKTIDNDVLGKDLDTIESAVKTMADALS